MKSNLKASASRLARRARIAIAGRAKLLMISEYGAEALLLLGEVAAVVVLLLFEEVVML